MRGFKIGDIEVGTDRLPLVIPEIGINHGGSLRVACEMIDAAVQAGARLVKHQTHVVEDEMSDAARKVIPGNSKESIYDVMEHCALSEAEEHEMMRYAESLGMEFISTPFSRAAADRLERFDVKAYKIGSGEMNNYPLLEHVADFGKPMIVSTGMNNLDSVEKAANILERKNVPYALLHCTNLYPTRPEQVRLGAMQQMMERFPGVPIGLSDHTRNNNACIAAIALGAAVVERHFTDSMSREGNDIVCSMDAGALRELLAAAEEVFAMRGGEKAPLAEEQVTIDFAFATVVAIEDIREGELFTEKNLWVKRPGTGEIRAEKYPKLLGRHAVCDIKAGTHITWSMVR
ncbi:MAG: polyhydroxyalkanoate biosynthesis repressor PhaR [Ruminococcaceae bacterium]|nr:polyhydroxyalkanoate biosynthesis repressor PhaR [Oscillospiraceae bacterium]